MNQRDFNMNLWAASLFFIGGYYPINILLRCWIKLLTIFFIKSTIIWLGEFFFIDFNSTSLTRRLTSLKKMFLSRIKTLLAHAIYPNLR